MLLLFFNVVSSASLSGDTLRQAEMRSLFKKCTDMIKAYSPQKPKKSNLAINSELFIAWLKVLFRHVLM